MKVLDRATQFDFWVWAALMNLWAEIQASYQGRHRKGGHHRAVA